MNLNWNFWGEGGCKTKKLSMGRVWIFSGTAHQNSLPSCITKAGLLAALKEAFYNNCPNSRALIGS